jgi:hypothetical protein
MYNTSYVDQVQPHINHQCQGHGYQQLLPADHAAQQQQQQQQQQLLHPHVACQQVHMAAYQQLHMQQLQLIPCMVSASAPGSSPPTLQHSCCYSNSYQQSCQPFNNMAHFGFVVPHVAPCSTSSCCSVAHLAQAAVAEQAGSCCSSSSTAWGVAHPTADMLLQQVAYQPPLQQQGGLRVPVEHIPRTHSQTLQQQQQHRGSPPVHALATALLHMLLTLVTLVLRMHKGVQAAASRAATVQGQCLQFVHQQIKLVSCAAEQAAAAEGVEDLWLLLQQSHSSTSNGSSTSNHSSSSSSSSSSSRNSSSTSRATTAIMAIEQQLLQQQAGNSHTTMSTAAHQQAACPIQLLQQQQQQQETASVGSWARLLVVLGLWAGVVWWACRWLLLQGPAATGAAVASTCQQGTSAAEHAALLAVEYLLHACYGVAWAVAKQMHRVMARAAQAVLVHGTAAAQRACCVVLWVVGFANGDSRQQRSQLQQLLVQVLRSAGAGVGWCWHWGIVSAEAVAAAVAAKLLRDASPVTQVGAASLFLSWLLVCVMVPRFQLMCYVYEDRMCMEIEACLAGRGGGCCCGGNVAARRFTDHPGGCLVYPRG